VVHDALAAHGAPVYVRRPIVHNMEVVRTLEAEGAVFVEELAEVPRGAVVVLSAHGSAPSVHADARARGLIAYDAVCPLVSKVHNEVRRHERDGRTVILIGHQGHPEIEGSLAQMRGGRSYLVNSTADVAALPLPADARAAYAVQTTYAVDEAQRIVDALQARFRDLVGPPSSDICYATTNRQAAVREISREADAVIVVGEHFSSNAQRLAEVARPLCSKVQLVAGPQDLDLGALRGASVIGITAAASTPEISVQAVIGALREQFAVRLEESGSMKEVISFKRLPIA
jgi:4-hydroxy-3-methylbut-2-enyl diphosphate reductase